MNALEYIATFTKVKTIQESYNILINYLLPHIGEMNFKAKAYFIGHMVYYGMHEVIEAPCKYIIFLRNPLEKFLSLFNHDRIIKKTEKNMNLNFETWIQEYKTKTIVGELLKDKLSKLIQAKFILKCSSFIGLQETFNSDVKKIFHADFTESRININECKSQSIGLEMVSFTSEELKLVNEILIEDWELYNYAITLREHGHNLNFTPLLNKT
jgi:hypothetical protein